MQKNQQFQKRVIMSLMGLVGILALVVILVSQDTPLVVERVSLLYRPLNVERADIKPTNESVAELVSEFIKIRYEWIHFSLKSSLKNSHAERPRVPAQR